MLGTEQMSDLKDGDQVVIERDRIRVVSQQ
jgi:hypothetical protein